MEIKLKGRDLPRNEKGDVQFYTLQSSMLATVTGKELYPPILSIFTPEEVVELVNRALYQLEYQRESHRKRGQAERDRMKALKEALKESGKDAKATEIEKQLKGE